MNHKIASTTLGLLLLGASLASTAATEYCTIPYLYATNIRSNCEQLGASGLSGLYQTSRLFDRLLNNPARAAVSAHKD